MRNFINIIAESEISISSSEARLIWDKMSPLAHYKLINRLPYLAGNDKRVEQAIAYIADHMDEFADEPMTPEERWPNLDDGNIHRLT